MTHYRIIPVIFSLTLLPVMAMAQGGAAGAASRQSPDSVFSRAVALNNEQRGPEARALVDSMLRVIQPTAAAFGDALFWKGVLAESEQVAEESYKRVVLDYPLHRRAEESLIRLAQLEIMRGNRVQAQRYLDRVVVEHPYGQYRAKASYWRARLFFEENEIDRACAELGTARARLPDNDVELKTEIDYAAQRCVNVPVPSARGAAPPAAGTTTDSGARRGGGAAARTGGAGATGNTSGGAAGRTGRATGATTQATGRGRATAARGNTDTTKVAKATAPPKAMWSVQAAAFPSKENAAALVEALKGRGYEARLVGTVSPYRVRVGMFATREEATRLATELKTKGISNGAYVVEAEAR